MAIATYATTEKERHYYFHIVETIYYNKKWRKVVPIGGFEPDMVHQMIFWGTPKIKKLLHMSIKVYEDEIFNTSVWYH